MTTLNSLIFWEIQTSFSCQRLAEKMDITFIVCLRVGSYVHDWKQDDGSVLRCKNVTSRTSEAQQI